jgi:hypothetical protein
MSVHNIIVYAQKHRYKYNSSSSSVNIQVREAAAHYRVVASPVRRKDGAFQLVALPPASANV